MTSGRVRISTSLLPRWSFGVSIVALAYLRRYIDRQDEGDQPRVGANRWVNAKGVVLEPIDPVASVGMVRILGEEWRATSDGPIPAGTQVIVDAMDEGANRRLCDAMERRSFTVTAKKPVEADFGGRPQPLPPGTLDKVLDTDGVAAAEGRMEGYAVLTDAHGKPLMPGGAPAVGSNLPESPQLYGDTELWVMTCHPSPTRRPSPTCRR